MNMPLKYFTLTFWVFSFRGAMRGAVTKISTHSSKTGVGKAMGG